ncbi:MAG TPA: 2-amino-4-hydroxy-6-hydroxymethyldihydropteridine diphosphokinase [Coriobacteriia bacterium]|jgi:2-amino-4-hydroxy-6-hydroxymethyldihydropteridine diphosphokinase
MIDAYIGLGSNLGDRLGNLARGLDAIAALPGTRVRAVSHAYESEPWGLEGQAAFFNAVALVGTDLLADQLLDLLKNAEEELGRKPTTRFGPREIDLDILLYGDEEWASDRLTIPHPRMAERDFVIRPLLEVAPGVRYPNGDHVTGERARHGRVIARIGPIPGWEQVTPPTPEARAAGTPERAHADLGPADFAGVAASADFRVAGKEQHFATPWGDDWVPLGVARLDPSPSMPELLFYEAVLKDAGVPCEFYPERPGEGFYNPYGVQRFVDLYVPASRLREARELVRKAREAPPAEE